MKRGSMVPSEEQEQALYFRWLEFVMINGAPLRPHVYHVANGGARHAAVAAKLKAQGVTAGVLDINLDVPAGPYHGLRIEMKRRGGRPTKSQLDQIELRRSMGYKATIAEGFDQARADTVKYLRLSFTVFDRWAG